MARISNNDVCQTLDVIATKLELLTQFNEERLRDVHEELKDIKLLVNDISKDHEHRLKTLEATQSYQRGVVGLALLLIGSLAIPILKVYYHL